MSPVPMKPNVVRCVVKLKRALKRWRNTAVVFGRVPSDVPSGHITIYVGAGFKRFVVRASYLNHPFFKHLLAQAEEEFGFVNQGPLVITCDESEFEEFRRLEQRILNCLKNDATAEPIFSPIRCCWCTIKSIY